MSERNTMSSLESLQREQGPLLEVKNLQIDFTTDDNRAVHAVRDASFNVYPGQWVAIVGESGSGKSTSAMAVLGLLPGTGHIVDGSIDQNPAESYVLAQLRAQRSNYRVNPSHIYRKP